MNKSWDDIKKELLSNPKVKNEYDKLAPEYEQMKNKIINNFDKNNKKGKQK